jgi:hypothetical protein
MTPEDRHLLRAAGLASAAGAFLRLVAAVPAILPDPQAREGLYLSVDLLLLFALFGLFAQETRLRRGLGIIGFVASVVGFVLIRTGSRLGVLGDYQTAALLLSVGLAIMGAAMLGAGGWLRAAGLAWIAALATGVVGAALHAPLGFLVASLLFCLAFGLAALALLRPGKDG